MTVHIGIAGALAAGKSTLAREIKASLEQRGHTVAIIPMAQAIKDLVGRLNGDRAHDYLEALATIDYDYGYTDCDIIERAVAAIVQAYQDYYTPNEKPRKLLQIIGTEIGRNTIDEDIWVKRVQARIAALSVDVVLTDDIRFDNEAWSVDYLIQIDTASYGNESAYAANKEQFSTQYTDTNHASEQGLTITPDLIIRCGFSDRDVLELTERIETWLPAS